MKRLLSIIIVLTLVAGLMPVMALAVDTQVIDFTGHDGLTPLGVEYDTAGWAVNTDGTCNYLIGDKWNTTTYLNKTYGLLVYFDNANSDGERAAIDFKVNETGWYDISANVSNVVKESGTAKPYDGYMSVWIDGKYAGQLDTVKGVGVNNLRPLYLEAGRHTFFICADETNTFTRYMRCVISNITLTPTTESNAQVVSAEMSLSATEAGTGDSITASAVLKYANGVETDVYTKSLVANEFSAFQTSSEDSILITSSNTDVAAASGNKITAKDVGEADITFTADLGKNGTASSSAHITVKPEATLRYKDDTSWSTSAASGYYMSSETKGNNWTIETDTKYTAAKQIDGTTNAVRLQSSVDYAYFNAQGPLTLNLDVPYAGTYDITVEHTAYPGNGVGDVYVNGEYVGSFNDNGTCAVTESIKSKLLCAELNKGANKITVYPTGTRIFPVAIEFESTNSADTLSIDATIDSLSINKKETAQITMSASASDGTIYTIKDSLFGGSTLNTTYKSSNEKVATVSESGLVTAVGAGEAEITVSADYPASASAYEETFAITVIDTAPGVAASEKVSVYVGATTGGTAAATGAAANEVVSADIGTSITATASAAEGYEFAYWKDSAGNIVSDSAKYTFCAYTNTSIIAVFDNISETNEKIGVEFFDGNRDYLGFEEVEAGTAFEDIDKPACGITGYSFIGWSIGNNEKINSFVRAVALYSETGNSVSGITLNGSDKTATYGEEIVGEDASAKAWYRDEELVAYGDSYTYLAWGSTAITSSTEEPAEKLPLAVLNADGDAYLLEYDNAGYEIVDAGIIFGSAANNTVNSCYYKAKVKNIKAHGQFTAKKSTDTKYEQSVVRGYVIFKDTDGELRVIYSK